MARRGGAAAPGEVVEVLLEVYAANGAMNLLILTQLDPRAWRAKLPGGKSSEGRSIAAIFAHLHNCRLVWLKWSAPHLKRAAALDPARCTIKQAVAAHRRSAAQCLEMLRDALGAGAGDAAHRRVTKFSRGSWVPEWPAGATMFAYMFAHEAHHRGQIFMLAHQLGYRLPQYPSIWHWEKLWKQCGFASRPR